MAKGIYCIRNNTTDERYIGSSVGMDTRWLLHKTKLNRNCHHALKLQRAWNTYGGDGFSFEILEHVTDPQNKTLVQREQHWIDHYNSYRRGYNSTPVAARPLTLTDAERGTRDAMIRYGIYEPKYIQNFRLHNPPQFDTEEQRKWQEQINRISDEDAHFRTIGWVVLVSTLIIYLAAAFTFHVLILLLPLTIWPIIFLARVVAGIKEPQLQALRKSEPRAIAQRTQDDLARVERQKRRNGPRVRIPRRRGHYWY